MRTSQLGIPDGKALVAGSVLFLFMFGASGAGRLAAQGLNVPAKTWGVSFGNSKTFTGLRFNFRDSRVKRITGVNVTFWRPKSDDNKDAVVNGLSLGVAPFGGRLSGVQVTAENKQE